MRPFCRPRSLFSYGRRPPTKRTRHLFAPFRQSPAALKKLTGDKSNWAQRFFFRNPLALLPFRALFPRLRLMRRACISRFSPFAHGKPPPIRRICSRSAAPRAEAFIFRIFCRFRLRKTHCPLFVLAADCYCRSVVKKRFDRPFDQPLPSFPLCAAIKNAVRPSEEKRLSFALCTRSGFSLGSLPCASRERTKSEKKTIDAIQT